MDSQVHLLKTHYTMHEIIPKRNHSQFLNMVLFGTQSGHHTNFMARERGMPHTADEMKRRSPATCTQGQPKPQESPRKHHQTFGAFPFSILRFQFEPCPAQYSSLKCYSTQRGQAGRQGRNFALHDFLKCALCYSEPQQSLPDSRICPTQRNYRSPLYVMYFGEQYQPDQSSQDSQPVRPPPPQCGEVRPPPPEVVHGHLAGSRDRIRRHLRRQARKQCNLLWVNVHVHRPQPTLLPGRQTSAHLT